MAKAKFIPTPNEAFHDFVLYRDVRIPMSDGIELTSLIYFPSKNGVVDFSKKYPVLLQRTPYLDMCGSSPNYLEQFATENGFVVILNGCRGTNLSQGVLKPVADDGWGTKTDGWGDKKDGVDTLKWIIKQPWSNGKVVTTGLSAVGATQYELWLTGETEGLETSVIHCPAMNSIDGGWVYAQDFVDANCMVMWALSNALLPGYFQSLPPEAQQGIMEDCVKVGNLMEHPEWLADADFFKKLQADYSYKDMPIARWAPFYQKWIENRDNPDFFAYNDTRTRKHDFNKPVVFHAGWFDLFEMNAINGYVQAVKDAPTEEIAKGHRLIVGAWNHNNPPVLPQPLRKFPENRTDQRLFIMEWFQQQVNGIESEYFKENPVSIFVMGENKWRSEQTWPLADEVRTKYYLHSAGAANTRFGNGALSTEKPAAEESDHYQADPANPVCPLGGNTVLMGGMCDQRTLELRPDVLVYTSGVLEEDVEVTGVPKATIYASTSATDTDFFVTLLDVCTDGNVYNIGQGGRRGRYIKNGRSNPEALTPGEINAFEIELPATSYVFKKGHQIRVEVTSSSAYKYDVNPNAFIDLNTCTKEDYVVATQTVYHETDHASFIDLPIIPASHERKWVEWPFSAEITGMESQEVFGLPAVPALKEYEGSELETV